MKIQLSSSNRVIVAMLAIAALAIAFWMLLLSPKREEASKLGAQVEELQASLAQHRAEAAQAQEAREEFPVTYQQLVVLGKAVPGDDDTASLLVQLNRIANGADVTFRNLSLEAASGTEAAPPVPAPAPEAGTPASSSVSPTEVAASMLPLGAAIGPAGLGVMPYTLTFDGEFFEIADFIKGLDSLVKTENAKVSVNGRLFTINGFSLEAAPNRSFPALQATFSVTTYLTPPTQGVTAGATPASPSATPVSTTTGGTP
jgi:type II secretory pathway pseudopilin PulG